MNDLKWTLSRMFFFLDRAIEQFRSSYIALSFGHVIELR